MADFFIVATPIGNYDDITIRAVKILKEVDFIVCEEEKEYKKLFYKLGLQEKKYILCNEHSETDAIELALPLLKNGEKGALISDCGTPLFEDPGFKLLQAVRNNNFSITSLPGANSIIDAISLSPYKIKDFYYTGLLPVNKEERRIKLLELTKRQEAIIIIDAPYRLFDMLNALKEHFKGRKISVAYNLTMEDEEVFSGSFDQVEESLKKNNIAKGEYIIIIAPENG